MAGCWYAVGLVFFVQLVLQTDCIAPSDRNPTCRTDFRYIVLHNWIPYAEDTSSGTAWKVLIDQYDYESLVGSGMSSAGWSTLDVDSDGKTFAHGSGGTCSFQLKIPDTFRTPNSNNWIFTQAIDYIDAVELIVNTTVRFTACTQRLNVQPPEMCTHDYVILHRYDTNTLSETQRTTTTNYQPYKDNSESSSRLQQDRNNIRSNTNIINRFRRPINFNYTYLGLRDIGSSGSVVRIFMYYEVCPRKVEGLAIYPEVPHPGKLPGASTRTTRLASCAEHSHNTTSLDTYAYQDGRCEQNITCVCDAGYEQSPQNPPQCVACVAGKYRSAQNASCINCPANSNSTMAASEYCSCNEGHYRVTGSEGVGMRCTAPPPRIPECTVSQSFDTGVTIQWTTPANCGGRTDCYYQITINDGSPKRHSPGFRPNTQETYPVDNLQPDTTYSITVSIHNGVSDQDSDNARIRECTIVAKTIQGSVFMLDGVTYLNNTAVLLEDIDANPPLICTTAHTSCCTGNTQVRFFYPDGNPILTRVPASSLLQRLYMTRNERSISLHLQAGERPPLGTYRCEIPDGRGILQNLYIRIGTAINPQGPNATTDEPTVIIVTAVVYDAIVLNIADTLNISLIDRIEALIQREASSSDSTQTKPPIIFTAPIMARRSLGQQQIVTIPQENITAIEKGLIYFVKIKPIFVNGSQGDYGLPFSFNGTAINPQGPNATTDEPTVIIVTAVVYDAIVLNIPDTLNISLIDRIEALIQREASGSDSTHPKPPIMFTAPIMARRSLSQQQIVTIPQENITAIEQGLTYFVKIKPIFVNGSRGDYGLPFLFNGTAINPQGPNATTDEPTMIIVTAVVYDAIVLNIPDTLNISLIDRIKALIQWEASASDSTQTKPPIIFIAPIMASRSLGQQQIVTIPQENITAIEKGLTYFVKIKPIFVNGSQGDYGLPFLFNGTITRNVLASTSTSTEVPCLNLYIFIGVAVGIVMLATIIIVLTCVVCLCKNHERKVVKHHPPMEEQEMEEQEMEEQEMKEQEMEEQDMEDQEMQVLKTDNCDSKE